MAAFREHHYNPPEQVLQYLSEALDIVEKLAAPEDLRGIAFAKAIDLVAAKQVTAYGSPGILGGVPGVAQ